MRAYWRCMGTHRGRYRIFQRAGVGCYRYGYFIHGHFVLDISWGARTKCKWTKMPVKIAKEDIMLTILWNREYKMLILSTHLIHLGPRLDEKEPTPERSSNMPNKTSSKIPLISPMHVGMSFRQNVTYSNMSVYFLK